MDIAVSQAQGNVPVTILHVSGTVDGSNYQELIAGAQKEYNGGARDILLDLGGVTYISSACIVALQSIAALVRGEELPDLESGWGAFRAVDRDRETGLQAHFKLLNPQPRVENVINMVGFTQFLEIHTDLDKAVASF
jgi:anti-anti-sigma regulatory factor